IINDLKVQGAQVIFRPDLTALSSIPGLGKNLGGLKQEYALSIPTLDLENIGNADGNANGAAIKDVVSLLVTNLAQKASESDQLPPELRDVLHLNVNDLKDLAKAKLGEELNKQLGKIGGGALGDVLKSSPDGKIDASKAVEQGLGNLLGQKDKKKK